jgi:putative copper export protein
MSAADVVVAVFRWLEYAGLLGFVGTVLLWRLSRLPPRLPWARPDMARMLRIASAGGLGALTAETLVSGVPPDVQFFRVAAEVAALLLCVRGGRFSVPVGLVAVLLLAPAGHAAQTQPAVPAILVDELHVLSAGMWAGGVFALASVRPPDGWRSEAGNDLLTRFGRVAMVAFAFTALTGLLRATEELNGLNDLWTTGYGIVLTLKSIGVLLMLVLAAITWRRGVPPARTDAIVALAVMAATGVLAAFPMPPAGA